MPIFSSKVPDGVRRLFRLPSSRARALREVDEELRIHFEMRTADLRALGLSEAEAQAEARRRFGDTAEFHAYAARRVARQARWHGAFEWLAAWMQDIRFANRQFRRNPGFTAVAVLTLALGIGANTAIFTVVDRLLLAPLPYPDGNRIVKLTLDGWHFGDFDVPILEAWRARARSVETFAAVGVDALMGQDSTEQDTVHAFITANYLQMLGVHPVLGRAFTAAEERPGGPAVAMISYGLWQRAYGQRTDVLGSIIHVDSVPRTIVGVAPRDMGPPMQQQGFRMHLREPIPAIWLPVSLDSMGRADLYARLRPGVSAQEASKELQSILTSVPGPGQNRLRVRAMRARDFLDPREAQTVKVLFVAVGALLLIACANVANLLMSRAWTRRRELAVRVALGAGRKRLARQVLTESVLLALAGGLLGVGVAWQTLRIVLALRPPALANLAGVHIESTVLLWSATISIMTGILFGSAPALFAGAQSVGDVLRNETSAGSGGVTSRRMRSALIVLEIAMSLVLLVGAGLLVRSFAALQQMPLGFDPHGLISVDVLFRPATAVESRVALRQGILERLRSLPGVTGAALGTLPDDAYGAGLPLETDSDAAGHSNSVPAFSPTFISPNYFRLARMSLVEGRLPDSLTSEQPADTGQQLIREEVVVNRGLAHRFWPDGRVLGSRLHAGGGGHGLVESFTVVGVVEDVQMPGVRSAIKAAQVYAPSPRRLPLATFLVRTAASPAAVALSLRRTVADVDPTTIVQAVTIGEDYLRDSLAPTRFAMALLTAFAVIALLLSAVGLYGVIAYSVTQRTREIGVRVAVGAEPRGVVRLVVGGGLRLAAGGVLVGVAVAAIATRALASLLYAVSPADPLTFAVIAVLVAAIALTASYVPARRALRIDPIEALRAD